MLSPLERGLARAVEKIGLNGCRISINRVAVAAYAVICGFPSSLDGKIQIGDGRLSPLERGLPARMRPLMGVTHG